MALIPGIMRAIAHYKAEKDRLADVDKRRAAGRSPDSLDFGPPMNLGDIGEEVARSHRMMGLEMDNDLPAPPALKAPRSQYPVYNPAR